ncbi:TIGR02281 family clan AA aspartic protease [Mesorhizobium xinjiangense]|uniref:TIGR02281 family clan AA aspartic protease n=1 Tax=Mesorhizobium xinjiangense TaxID=2678685 RepID=UPI001F3CDB97|nr:TIGR02281 family clan AA aspartic protease [Mesorhizobium xinjiangense]
MRHVTFLGAVIGLSLAVPALHEANPDWLRAAMASLIGRNEDGSTEYGQNATAHKTPPAGRKVALAMGSSGHFLAEFKLNGRRVEAMVDTGATLVAVNRSTARRLGISLSNADFRYAVGTANGQAMAAGIVLDRVEIGRIAVKDVPAAVLEDEALSSTLIGMSFLKRLARFEVADNTLLLEQ